MTPDYEHMSLADLSRLRGMIPANDPMQQKLAYYDHQAFARDLVRNHPILGPLELLLAVPGYSAAKKLHLIGARTPASIGEMAAGYNGMWQGMQQNLHPYAHLLRNVNVSVLAPMYY